MDYGIRLSHAGKDFFELKNPIRAVGVELRTIRIYNLKSIYDASLPEVKTLPMEKSTKGEWKVFTRCFSIDWNIGLHQLTVSAESKLKTFFATKFHPITFIIEPLVVHLKLRVCFPFLEAPQPSRSSQSSPLNLLLLATFSIDLEDANIKHWEGVRIKGKGTFNKLVGFAINSGLFKSLIQKEIIKKMKKYLPEKFVLLKNKIHSKMSAFVNKTIDRYGVKAPRNTN